MTNFASGVLAQELDSSSTTAILNTGDGNQFPSPTAPEKMILVLEDVNANKEIVYLTEVVGDTLTIERAQENTIALTFPVGSRVENRLTAGTISIIDCGTF